MWPEGLSHWIPMTPLGIERWELNASHSGLSHSSSTNCAIVSLTNIDKYGARQLGNLYSRVCGIDSEIQMMSNWLHTEGSESIEKTPEGSGKKASQKNSTSGPEAVWAEENAAKDRMEAKTRSEKAGHGTKSKPRNLRTKMGASHWFCYR